MRFLDLLQELTESDGLTRFDKLLCTASRGVGKTQLGWIWVCWITAFGIRRSIGVIGYDEDACKKLLKNILGHFEERHEDGEKTLFTSRFNYVANTKRAKVIDEDSIDLTVKSMSEWSLSTGGALVPIAARKGGRGAYGGRYRLDAAIFDDVETHTTAASEKETSKIRQAMKSIFAAHTNDKNRPIISLVLGNYVWRTGNIHWLAEMSREQNSLVRYLRYTTVVYNEYTDTVSSNSANLTQEQAVALFHKNKEEGTLAELLDRPDQEGDNVFSPLSITIVDKSDVENIPTTKYIVVDPAMGNVPKACPIGQIIVYADEKGRFYFSGKEYGGLHLTEYANKCINLCDKLNVAKLFIEGGGMQEAVKLYFREKIVNLDRNIIVDSYNYNKYPKLDRVFKAKEILESTRDKFYFIGEECRELLPKIRSFKYTSEPTRAEKADIDVLDCWACAMLLIDEQEIVNYHLNRNNLNVNIIQENRVKRFC